MKKINEAIEELNDLRRLLEDRVADLHQVKGGMQARHAFLLYRNRVLDIIRILEGDK